MQKRCVSEAHIVCKAGTGGAELFHEDRCGWEEAVHVDGGERRERMDTVGGESCEEKRQRLIRKKNVSRSAAEGGERGLVLGVGSVYL